MHSSELEIISYSIFYNDTIILLKYIYTVRDNKLKAPDYI